MPGRRDLPSGLVRCFLHRVAAVALDPIPLDRVPFRGLVQTRPPIMIRFPPKAARHRFDDISRVTEKAYAARFFQFFKPEGGRSDLGLLIRCTAKKFPDAFPKAAKTEKSYRSSTRFTFAVSEA